MWFFDSLAHPTLTGQWPGKNLDAGVNKLVADMEVSGFRKALAVGLPAFEGYTHEGFMNLCKPHPALIPVAAMDTREDDYETELNLISKLGFTAIKIHPRLSRLDYEKNRLPELFRACNKRGLKILYCTYAHCRVADYPHTDPFYALVRALSAEPETPVMLMHGGDIELMKYAELVRHNPSLLLDLSMTMMKYRGSSLDSDLVFLFRLFDRRICMGTDHPEWTHSALKQRFEELFRLADITEEKQENIAHANLEKWLGLA